jgi:hypothetical protein
MENDRDLPPDVKALLELEREIAPEHSVSRYLIEYGTPSLIAFAGAIWIKGPSAIAQLCALFTFLLVAFWFLERRALRRLRLVVAVLRKRRGGQEESY